MELIFKKIKNSHTLQFIEKASSLGIDDATLVKLFDSIVAGLLGAFLAQGDNEETEKIFKTFASEMDDDGQLEISIFDEEITSKKYRAAIALGDTLLFNRRREFISFLAIQTEVNEVQIEKPFTYLISVVGLCLGRKLMTGEYTITGLLAQVHAERNFFLGYIHSRALSILGLSSLLTVGKNLSSDAKVISDMVFYEIMYGNTPVKEKKNNWKKWFFSKAAL